MTCNPCEENQAGERTQNPFQPGWGEWLKNASPEEIKRAEWENFNPNPAEGLAGNIEE